MSRIVVITGGSSGIGLAAAQAFAKAGDRVYELSRSGADAESIRHIQADLADEAQIESAFAAIGAEAGRIDILINNAGWGISGPLETTDSAAARQLFDIDFFAAFLCAKYALPWLRQAGSGAKIINISSVAAVFAIPYQSFYSAAKAAVNALTFSLANELRGFDIGVTALMPGDVASNFTANRQKQDDSGLYPAAEGAVAAMERDEKAGMQPEKIAARLLAIAAKPKVKPLYSCGFKYQFFLFLGKILPCDTVNYIVSKMYK